MEYNDLISAMKRFGVCDEAVCINSLGIASDMIHDNVIITPGWEPQRLPGLGKAELLISSAPLYGSKVWNIKNGEIEMTFIKTGCGAPAFMDTLLPLGMSQCKRIIFISSVGALDTKIGIGDIVIPEYSVCGDGASRYIASNKLGIDVFGERVYPDASLLQLLKVETENICNENNVKWHIGEAFCTDTIFAQFPHIDSIISTGCNLIDMETASAFRAAKLMKKPLVALLCASDNMIANKSLMGGRTQDEETYMKFVRREVMPNIILSLIKADRCI
ncbi:phosphorylase [Clostridium manihotivorum]|uniref:Phosphorylase n=1 Tax=Clostridium manihotivorum TaxID=2320868 RepID=A0A410DSJ0_9CLOT|nr:phosphorylase [Clostridium manihotivorum]QAA32193.1 phosphorylase [Clostridium manihotivorum]